MDPLQQKSGVVALRLFSIRLADIDQAENRSLTG
jgi:hypothetical protein